MGSYLDIQDDPNEVTGTGAILRSIGTSFQTQAQGILAEINGVNAERPWGNDEYGQAFEQTYNTTPEGSDGPLRDAVDDGLSRAGEHLIKIGDKTVTAMTEYQGVDDDNRIQIDQTNISI
ncbi:hypothetical protein [Phytohabitans kaempferiae]|uniref:WXG100 family type VII secretion target n=1 Tax=Phytohabitans kaempferiae TaxID=1620943 RepID=A0ABV6M8L9_9ACTN